MKTPSKTLFLTLLCYGVLGSFVELFENALKRMAVPMMAYINESMTNQFGTEPSDFAVRAIFTTLWNIPLVASMVGMFVVVPIIDSRGRRIAAAYAKPLLSITASGLVVASRLLNVFELLFVAMIFHGFADSIRVSVTKLYLSECAPNELRAFAMESSTAIISILCVLSNYLLVNETFGTPELFFYPFVFFAVIAALFLIIAPRFPESPKFLHSRGRPRLHVVHSITSFHGKHTDIEAKIAEYNEEVDVTKKVSCLHIFSDPKLRACYLRILVLLLPFYFGYYTISTYNYNILLVRFGWSNTAATSAYSVSIFFALPFAFLLPVVYEAIGRRIVALIGLGCMLGTTICFCVAQFIVDLNGGVATDLSSLVGVAIALGCGFNYVNGAASAFMVVAMDIVPINAKLPFMQVILLTRNVLPLVANYMFVFFDPLLGAGFYLPMIVLQLYATFYIYRTFSETKGQSVAANCRKVTSSSILIVKRADAGRSAKYGSVP